ncbi:CbiQ family ECF transporter T component [Prochlorococcus marinus]|uniref:Cobalt ABC transporter permease n=1 Tax=Prochlorococcus marinus XMU1408 TaxID=2213228 RepID=A0A318R4E9_PROMR|nr:CbiQ family ECF transporter T component [Prochlorococcus marinus]MBW3041409.1 cobalt ABC transporter permease [Prochlorococcus marinus str. XMU1408]PYE02572.1 cobalt ABC transporter permease [Prochlorococcus marinus XMU1408]
MDWLKKIPIGQYVSGKSSWLRVIDPRVKLSWVLLFLLTPILANSIWRISIAYVLLLITFFSFLPLRVWWRPFVFLLVLSLVLGLLSIVLPASEASSELAIRAPDEIPGAIVVTRSWEIFRVGPFNFGGISLGPLIVDRRSAELGIKTSTLIFTVIHSVNLMLITTPPEDLVWAIRWFFSPLTFLGFPLEKFSFQLLLALRFLPLVQEELQNLFRSIGVRAIEFRKLGLKSTLNVFISLGERLLSNILLRAEQGADSLMLREGLWLSSEQLRPSIVTNPRYLWINFGSIFLLLIAIILRCLYGTT